ERQVERERKTVSAERAREAINHSWIAT
ncbi:hypothetical protein KIPB_013052, partial [Kipferlia bialata]